MFQLLTHLAAEEEKSGLAVLGINPVSLLLQLVTFLILFLLLKKFAFKSIVHMLEERRRKIDQGIELGQEMELEKQQLDEQVKKVMHKARQEADKIIAAGHQEANTLLKEAEATAQHKTDIMLAEAKDRIAEEIKQAERNLEKEVLGLVADATTAVLQEKVDATKDKALIEKALREART